jgi:hypothetical protein
MVMVNRVALPLTALPTFFSFPHFHAFKIGDPRTIWDSLSSNMEKPNVNEKEHATRFPLTPHPCKAFLKEHFRGFWGNLWISLTSHGFSI